MALKTFRPTTPGLRHLVLVDRAQLWKGAPVKVLVEGKSKFGRPQQRRPHHDAPHRRRRTSGRIAWSTSAVASSTRRARSSASSTIRIGPPSSR